MLQTDDAYSLASRVHDGEVSATQLVEDCLTAIASPAQKDINAFVFVDEEGALTAAARVDKAREQGEPLGRLAGVPFGVKELQQVEGWPDTLASEAFRERVAPQTDTMVRRLVAEGAVPIGLTASPELGRSSFCSTPLHGTTRNPWDLALTTGGSSSGSAAAVAAGVTAFSTGSDGAGSLRIPASYCGVVGFKPTAGIVARGPKFGGTAGNQVYGPIATTVRDIALLMDCIAGIDDGEFGTVPAPGSFLSSLDGLPRGLRVAFSPGLGYSPVAKDVRRATEIAARDLIEAMGAVPVDLEDRIAFPDAGPAFRALSMLDVWSQVRELPAERMELLAPSVRQYSDLIRQASFDDYLDAQQRRATLTRHVGEIFDEVDLLVTPCTPVTAFAAEGPMPREIDGESVDHWGSLRLTYPFNLTGHPAISIPVAGVEGAPIGLQIVGPRFGDERLLAAAARYEAEHPWRRHAMTEAGSA